MGDNKYYSGFIKTWLMGFVLCGTVRSEERVKAPSSDLICISDCSTCPVICSPPPPIVITKSPSLPSYLSPPPPPSPPSHSSGIAPPPPPLKSYNTPPSGLAQPQPTLISAPHDFSYPYYYFYTSAASSLSIHAPLFLFLFFLIAYSILANH
ncbi:hypothetical protein CR513_34012, partial [Mucuna pruriens]